MSPLDVSAKGHVDRAIAVRLFSRVRPPGRGVDPLITQLNSSQIDELGNWCLKG